MLATRRFALPFMITFTIMPMLVTDLSGQAEEQKQRPNFLLIIADDQAPETLRCYGNKVCQTPNIDNLASRGMVMHDAHHLGSWSGAVCLCSRTMLMTGRTLWRIPVNKRIPLKQPEGFRKAVAQQSLPAIFNRAGYKTFRTCKRGNSFKQANELFQVVRDATRRQGSDEKGSKWHGDQVVEYLKQRDASKDRNPFLIYMGFSHPHDPRNAPEKLARKYGASNKGPGERPDPKAPPLQVNYLPAHPFHHGHPRLRDEVHVQGVKRKRDEATIRNELGREYGCIENIDIQVGRVVEQLKKMGQLENTYIIYTADHGIAVGRHGLTGKQNLYEHTWRVPFIVVGPGIKANSKASGFVYLHDILPTFCDLAGVAIPAGVEGRSFRSVMEGKSERIRKVVHGIYCGGTKPGMRSVKTADGWKLIKYDVMDPNNKRIRKTQMFNLKENPHEFLLEHHNEGLRKKLGIKPGPNQKNLADDPRYAKQRKLLESLLKKQMQQLGDPFPFKD